MQPIGTNKSSLAAEPSRYKVEQAVKDGGGKPLDLQARSGSRAADRTLSLVYFRERLSAMVPALRRLGSLASGWAIER
jgi:hypothetical protein